jgi:hypothetical protein
MLNFQKGVGLSNVGVRGEPVFKRIPGALDSNLFGLDGTVCILSLIMNTGIITYPPVPVLLVSVC